MIIHVDINMSFALAWRKKFNLSLLSFCLKYQSLICPLCLSVCLVYLSILSLKHLAEDDVDERLDEYLCVEPP